MRNWWNFSGVFLLIGIGAVIAVLVSLNNAYGLSGDADTLTGAVQGLIQAMFWLLLCTISLSCSILLRVERLRGRVQHTTEEVVY